LSPVNTRLGRSGSASATLVCWAPSAASATRKTTRSPRASSAPSNSSALDRHAWRNRTELALAIFEWIESWYNPRRRHPSIGDLAPVEHEQAASRDSRRAPAATLRSPPRSTRFWHQTPDQKHHRINRPKHPGEPGEPQRRRTSSLVTRLRARIAPQTPTQGETRAPNPTGTPDTNAPRTRGRHGESRHRHLHRLPALYRHRNAPDRHQPAVGASTRRYGNA
jgi:hypothetical protein